MAPGVEDAEVVLRRSVKAFSRLSLALVLASVIMPRAAWAQSASQLHGLPHANAWRALEEHRYGDAADLFEAATRVRPSDAALWFGVGVAALMRGLNGHAQLPFEKALAIDPALTDASILLGQALYREGRVEQAITAYERALLHAPTHAELVEALSRWRREVSAEAPFHSLLGEHFEVKYLPPDDAVAHRALAVLEAAHERLGRELSVSTLRRVEVVLYSPDQFKAVTNLPAWAVGIYDGRIKVPLGGTSPSAEDLHRVLEHELVHAIVAAIAGPTVPAWLNEGLATALEPDGADWTEEVHGLTPSLPLLELPRGFRTLMPAEARAAYATSTRVVLALLDRHGAAAVVRLLRTIGRGLPFPEAFQEAVGMTLEAFVSTVD